ncbi:MAG TPA: hypothetical protein VFB04_05000, partial [Terriglobales bacterium]|nr:hypothetical protein [Terriglobales bacterium]
PWLADEGLFTDARERSVRQEFRVFRASVVKPSASIESIDATQKPRDSGAYRAKWRDLPEVG